MLTVMGLIIPSGSNNPAEKLNILRFVGQHLDAAIASFSRSHCRVSLSQSYSSPNTLCPFISLCVTKVSLA